MGRYSGGGLKEIAYDLGFPDRLTSAGFLNFYGVNFSEYKRRALVVPVELFNISNCDL